MASEILFIILAFLAGCITWDEHGKKVHAWLDRVIAEKRSTH